MANSATGANISETGIDAPIFNDILTYYKDQYKAIMGSDGVVSNDSKTGQLLAVIAQAQSDSNSAVIQAYNGFSPTYSLGTNLSSLVQINGLQRLISSKSSAIIRCTGVAGTHIAAGKVKDLNGNIWNLIPFDIPATPDYIDVLAYADVSGAISASSGSISIINNPTLGWQTAVSIADAAPGNPVETDYELRNRQAISTAFPALSTHQSIIAGALNIPGVSDAILYENSTGVTDSNSLPPHSISLVTKGGSAMEIALMFAQKKSPGVNTYGSTTEQIYIAGSTLPISFSIGAEVIVTAIVTINPFNTYTSVIGSNISTNLSAYISSLGIGNNIYKNSCIAAISQKEFNIQSLVFTISSGTATIDTNGNVLIPYNEYSSLSTISLVIV